MAKRRGGKTFAALREKYKRQHEVRERMIELRVARSEFERLAKLTAMIETQEQFDQIIASARPEIRSAMRRLLEPAVRERWIRHAVTESHEGREQAAGVTESIRETLGGPLG